MKLSEALSAIHPVMGASSVIAALFGAADPSSVSDKKATDNIAEVAARIEEVKNRQDNCQSDAAWWGYEGQLSYLKAVYDVLTAAELVGKDNLPDVDPPRQDGIVMDIYYQQEQYGKEILRRAQEATNVKTTG